MADELGTRHWDIVIVEVPAHRDQIWGCHYLVTPTHTRTPLEPGCESSVLDRDGHPEPFGVALATEEAREGILAASERSLTR